MDDEQTDSDDEQESNRPGRVRIFGAEVASRTGEVPAVPGGVEPDQPSWTDPLAPAAAGGVRAGHRSRRSVGRRRGAGDRRSPAGAGPPALDGGTDRRGSGSALP